MSTFENVCRVWGSWFPGSAYLCTEEEPAEPGLAAPTTAETLSTSTDDELAVVARPGDVELGELGEDDAMMMHGADEPGATQPSSGKNAPSDLSVSAIFVYGLAALLSFGGDEEAIRILMTNRYVAIVLLLMTVVFPMSDTYTDVALTIDWLQPDSPDRWYGRISASILCVASIVPACFMLAVETELGRNLRAARLYDPGNGRFHPMLGFVLSVTQTRLPVTAALQMYDIARNGVHDKYTTPPVNWDGGSSFSAGAFFERFGDGTSAVLMQKMFELLCESIAEIFLQTYKLAHDYFAKDLAPGKLLAGSIVVGLCTFAFGVAGTILNREQFTTKALAMLYFLASLVARFAVMIALFIEFGKWGVAFVVVGFGSRIAMTYKRIGRAGESEWVKVGFVFGVFDYALLLFLPIGSKVASGGAHEKLITLNGVAIEPLVEDKLVSPWALRNLALTLVENGIAWLCVLAIDSDLDVSSRAFALFGLLPMALMPALLGATRRAARLRPAEELEPADEEDGRLRVV